MCTHSIDDLFPHAPLHCAATGEMVKGSYYSQISLSTTYIYEEYDTKSSYICAISILIDNNREINRNLK